MLKLVCVGSDVRGIQECFMGSGFAYYIVCLACLLLIFIYMTHEDVFLVLWSVAS